MIPPYPYLFSSRSIHHERQNHPRMYRIIETPKTFRDETSFGFNCILWITIRHLSLARDALVQPVASRSLEGPTGEIKWPSTDPASGGERKRG